MTEEKAQQALRAPVRDRFLQGRALEVQATYWW